MPSDAAVGPACAHAGRSPEQGTTDRAGDGPRPQTTMEAIMARTYRAAYWTDGQGGELVLTAPEHAHLSDEELLAEARAEAERVGLDLSDGRIEVGEWYDPCAAED